MGVHFSGRFEIGDDFVRKQGLERRDQVLAQVRKTGVLDRIARELPDNAILSLGPVDTFTLNDPTKRRQADPEKLFLLVKEPNGSKRLVGSKRDSVLVPVAVNPGIKGTPTKTLAELVQDGLERYKKLLG